MIAQFVYYIVFIWLMASGGYLFTLLTLNDVPGAWKFLIIPLIPAAVVLGTDLLMLLLGKRTKALITRLEARMIAEPN